MKKRMLLMLGVVAVSAVDVSAHHSFAAEYDANKPVTLRGVVTKFELTMPHAWVRLDATDENGKTGAWSAEFGNPNALLRRGWSKTTLTPGMEVTIEGSRARDGSNTVHTTVIKLPDGRSLLNPAVGNVPDTNPNSGKK